MKKVQTTFVCLLHVKWNTCLCGTQRLHLSLCLFRAKVDEKKKIQLFFNQFFEKISPLGLTMVEMGDEACAPEAQGDAPAVSQGNTLSKRKHDSDATSRCVSEV